MILDNEKLLSSINLDGNKSVEIAESARAVAYFCKKLPVRIDKKLIGELKTRFKEIGDKNLRICLHDGPQALLHEMIILQRKGKYYRPHKHLNKGETFCILEGRMGIFSFNDEGGVIDSCILDPKDSVIYKVKANMYHAVMPISELVVYLEVKLGPFHSAHDSIFPSWASDGTDAQEIKKYNEYLRKKLITQS